VSRPPTRPPEGTRKPPPPPAPPRASCRDERECLEWLLARMATFHRHITPDFRGPAEHRIRTVLAETAPAWSSDPPTVPGWYWRYNAGLSGWPTPMYVDASGVGATSAGLWPPRPGDRWLHLDPPEAPDA